MDVPITESTPYACHIVTYIFFVMVHSQEATMFLCLVRGLLVSLYRPLLALKNISPDVAAAAMVDATCARCASA